MCLRTAWKVTSALRELAATQLNLEVPEIAIRRGFVIFGARVCCGRRRFGPGGMSHRR
jgi:hypothetical protein